MRAAGSIAPQLLVKHGRSAVRHRLRGTADFHTDFQWQDFKRTEPRFAVKHYRCRILAGIDRLVRIVHADARYLVSGTVRVKIVSLGRLAQPVIVKRGIIPYDTARLRHNCELLRCTAVSRQSIVAVIQHRRRYIVEALRVLRARYRKHDRVAVDKSARYRVRRIILAVVRVHERSAAKRFVIVPANRYSFGIDAQRARLVNNVIISRAVPRGDYRILPDVAAARIIASIRKPARKHARRLSRVAAHKARIRHAGIRRALAVLYYAVGSLDYKTRLLHR